MSFESYKQPNKLELLPSISEGITAERQNIIMLRLQIESDNELTPKEKMDALLELGQVALLNNKQAQLAERLQQAA